MKKLLALSAMALLCVAGQAAAATLPLPSGPLYIKFDNVEFVDTSLNDTLTVPGYAPAAGTTSGNWGLVAISTLDQGTITNMNNLIGPGTPPLYFTDGSGGQITGIFYDIDLTDPNHATGGYLDLFWHDNPSSLSVSTVTPDAAGVASFTSGTFLARIAYVPGIAALNATPAGDCTTTIYSDAGVNAASGFADSYGNVVVGATVGGQTGAWAQQLDGNWFTNPCGGFSDLRFKNSFNQITDTNDPWYRNPANGILGLRSSDPAQAFAVAPIPEPASLTLLGLGLAGLAARRRRKA